MEKPEVKISRQVKRISLQRFLLSKIRYFPEKVGLRDVFAIYENQLWLETKSSSDIDFYIKFGESLGEISSLLKRVNFSKEVNVNTLHRLTIESKVLEEFLIPKRNYSAFESRFNGSFELIGPTQPGILKRFLPPKKVIGLGYRDKGTLKNTAIDGSPSWQEISSSQEQVAFISAKKGIEDAKTFDDITVVFAKLFRGSNFSGLVSSETPKLAKEIERQEAEKRRSEEVREK